MGSCINEKKFICKACGKKYDAKKEQIHECSQKVVIRSKKAQQSQSILRQKVEKSQILKYLQKYKGDTHSNSTIFVKVRNIQAPNSEQSIHIQEKFEPRYQVSPAICEMSPMAIKIAPFQEKLAWFRERLEKHRISWQEGCQKILIDRQNILFSGIQAMEKLNFHKQIKIDFKDQNVDDAGGLLREWMHLSMNQIFSQQLGLFELCVTKEKAYKIVWDKDLIPEFVQKALRMLGFIIGKAIFQKIPLGCFLNHTLIRLLCGEAIQISDTYSYDKDFYKNWKQTLQHQNVQELGLDYCIYKTHKDGKTQLIQLIKNGKNTMVTHQNKEQFIKDTINYYCYESIKAYVEILKDSLQKIIPRKLLQVFEPYEFDALLNGPSFIDVQNWRRYTQYEGYTPKDEIIINFWQIIRSFNQEKLRNMLHYCTGTKRVPIHGFSHLESNRGQRKQFNIRKIAYQKNMPYPKAYTCFNRLQLPQYQTRQQLSEKLNTIAKQQIVHFGLG